MVAGWQFAEWGHLEPGDSFAARVADLERQAASRGGVVGSCGVEGDEPLGCAGVMEQTWEVYRASPGQRDLSPWLASVYVRPEARGRGVATGLVRHATAQVAKLGIRRFYLFTDSARGLYETCGWRVIGIRPARRTGDHDHGD